MKGRRARDQALASRRRARRGSFWLISLLVAAQAPRAHAQADTNSPAAAPLVDDATRAASRQLGDTGVAAYRLGNYEEASERLEKAFNLMPVPSLALWTARALVARGLWTRAAERYLSARGLGLGPGNPQIQLASQRKAEEERAALMPRIPSIRVVLVDALAPDVSLSIDAVGLPGLPVGEDWPVDPGEHVVVGVRGEERVEVKSSVKEGEHAQIVLRFVDRAAAVRSAPPPVESVPSQPMMPAQSNPAPGTSSAALLPIGDAEADLSVWRSVGWGGIAVGGAALLTSGILGIVAKRRGDELRNSADCVGDVCLDTDEVESYNRLVDLSTVGWITGATVAFAGALLVIVVPGSEGSTQVSVGPSAIELSGQF